MMQEKKICPKCRSPDTEINTILGSTFLVCNSCGYDESEDLLDVYPEGRSTQKGKSGFTPYKRGGGRRTAK